MRTFAAFAVALPMLLASACSSQVQNEIRVCQKRYLCREPPAHRLCPDESLNQVIDTRLGHERVQEAREHRREITGNEMAGVSFAAVLSTS